MSRQRDVDADYDDMVTANDEEDARLAQRSREMWLGTLSSEEAALIDHEFKADTEEGISSLLYQHLYTAQQRRLAMERMTQWCQEYVVAYREREQALALAHKHYRRLTSMRVNIEALLAQMFLAEGLIP